MKFLIILIVIFHLLPLPVHAFDIKAPAVPEAGAAFMPEDTESFTDGLWSILKDATDALKPAFADAVKACSSIIAVTIMGCIVKSFPGASAKTVDMVCVLLISYVVLQPANILLHLAVDTVENISNYGKLLLPALTTALAANGGVTKSAALYTGTLIFDAALCSASSSIILPLIYIFLCLSVSSGTIGNLYITKIKSFIKWGITWGLKIVLYIFSGFMTITGVITGSADATAVKATKLTISGMVPVVGGLLSDASETVLISAGIVKNSVGIYGLLATIAIWIGPFIRIGSQYLVLKITGAFCSAFTSKECSNLIDDFSTAMGFILAMICTTSLLLLISIVCFMKGVT
jgi:stage III sporulation protein AE